MTACCKAAYAVLIISAVMAAVSLIMDENGCDVSKNMKRQEKNSRRDSYEVAYISDVEGATNNLDSLYPRTQDTNSVRIGTNTYAGGTATAADFNPIAIGNSAAASNNLCIAIGYHSIAGRSSAGKATAIGAYAIAANSGSAAASSTALGYLAEAIGAGGSIAIGDTSLASSQDTIAIGRAATASGAHSESIGSYARATTGESIAIGGSSYANAYYTVAIGSSAQATGYGNISVGYNARSIGGMYTTVIGYNLDSEYRQQTVAIGYNHTIGSSYSTLIGRGCRSSGDHSCAIGSESYAIGAESSAFGRAAGTGGANATAIGSIAYAGAQESTAIGRRATAKSSYSSIFGYNAYGENSLYGCAFGSNTKTTNDYATTVGYGAHSHGTGTLNLSAYGLGMSGLYIDDESLPSMLSRLPQTIYQRIQTGIVLAEGTSIYEPETDETNIVIDVSNLTFPYRAAITFEIYCASNTYVWPNNVAWMGSNTITRSNALFAFRSFNAGTNWIANMEAQW